MGKLTATEVKQAKPGEKLLKLADGGGMYLQVHTNDARYWRYDYRYAGKRKTLALGVYPEVSLKEAREKHQEARDKLRQGIDPGEVRKVEKLTRHLAAAESFEAVAREWFNQIMPEKSTSYRERTARILGKDLYPYLGNRPITSVTPIYLWVHTGDMAYRSYRGLHLYVMHTRIWFISAISGAPCAPGRR